MNNEKDIIIQQYTNTLQINKNLELNLINSIEKGLNIFSIYPNVNDLKEMINQLKNYIKNDFTSMINFCEKIKKVYNTKKNIFPIASKNYNFSIITNKEKKMEIFNLKNVDFEKEIKNIVDSFDNKKVLEDKIKIFTDKVYNQMIEIEKEYEKYKKEVNEKNEKIFNYFAKFKEDYEKLEEKNKKLLNDINILKKEDNIS